MAHPNPAMPANPLFSASAAATHPGATIASLVPARDGRWLGPLLMALVAHALLVAALTWGIGWEKDKVLVAEAELWSRLPSSAAARAVDTAPVLPTPPPPTEPIPAPPPPPPPPPTPDRAAALQAQASAQAQAAAVQADIALQRQRDKQRQETLRQQQAAAQAREQAAQAQRDQARAQQDKAKAEQAAQAKKAAQEQAAQEKAARDKANQEQAAKDKAAQAQAAKAQAAKDKAEHAKQQAREHAAQAKEEQQLATQLAKERAANIQRIQGMAGASGQAGSTGTAQQSSGPSSSYAGRVIAAVRPNIVFTETLSNNPTAEVEVRTLPDGTVASRRIVKSSGVPHWDEAVLKALDRTARLPLDVGGRVYNPLIIEFRPKE